MNAPVVELLQQIRDRGHDVWEAGPAKPSAVQQLEKELAKKLPPSYKAFLLTYGAITIYDNTISGIIAGDQIRGSCGCVLNDTEVLSRDAQLPEGFLVVGPHEDGAYCLDFNRQRADGECPVVNFERHSIQHEDPVAGTFEEWLIKWQLQGWAEEAA